MVVKLIQKLFGKETESKEKGTGKTKVESTSEPNIEDFVTYVTRSLVDNPDAVSVTAVEKPRTIQLQIECEKRDIGKVIGKNGKTIAAIRALANGAAGRMGKKVNIEIVD